MTRPQAVARPGLSAGTPQISFEKASGKDASSFGGLAAYTIISLAKPIPN